MADEEGKVSTSPVIRIKKEKEFLDFPSAMRKVIEGKMVTKEEWGNKDIYGVLKDGLLMLHKDDGKFYKWLVSDGDLLGLDWVVVNDN